MFKKTHKQQDATRLLAGPYKHILLYGGSRSGKTFIFIRAMIIRALKCKSRHLITRYRFNHAKQSIWYDTFPDVMNTCFPDVPYTGNKSDWFWTFPNGSEIWIGGLDDKERTEKILGNEYSTILFNEISQISYDSITTALTRLSEKTELTNRAYYDENPPSKKHWSYLYFIEGIHPETRTPIDKSNIAYMRINPLDNIENISDDYIETILDTLPARKRSRFRDGEFTDDNERALWKRWMIDDYRIQPKDIPQMQRIVVAIDPAVTSKPESDETGIVVVGEGPALKDMKYEDMSHYYILNDCTIRETPLKWGRVAIDEYMHWDADRIIAEVNNGGDLVETNLRNISGNIPYTSIHATRGKMVRAEPVSALYEQGRVHHVYPLTELEDEMCDHEFTTTEPSPNRLDALVWGISFLAGLGQGTMKVPHYSSTDMGL